ncbi:hypothetical protein BJ322DRAFT_1037931 [Thelephora terrestris]|uniref:Uncharacterized protein n=1 Tax=Thelephora terrestris TaxID=56493 RepID=A0A9P6HP10_9AGAM|nr:hypothetical protein BJ322DRAFT_1037931 [Thelephora terrestris]
MAQSSRTRERTRRSSDVGKSGDDVTFAALDHGLVQRGGRERELSVVTMSPSRAGSGSSVFGPPKRLSRSPLGKPDIGDVSMDDRAMCHHPSVLCRHDRPMSTHAVVAAADTDDRNFRAVGDTEMGKSLVADGQLDDEKIRTRARSGNSPVVGGIFRDVDDASARGSPRVVTVGSLTVVGTPRGMEPPTVGSRKRDGAVENREGDEGKAGKDAKRANALRQAPPNITNSGTGHVGSDGSDSNSNLLSVGSRPQDDQRVGMDCEVEDYDPVPGQLDDEAGEKVDVDSELSLRRRDCPLECGVDGSTSQRIDEGGESRGFEDDAFFAPTDPYTEFVFGLDGTTRGDSKRTGEAGTGAEHTSALETLRCLESAMGPPTGVDTTVDLVPMDIETYLSNSIPRRLSPGGGETRFCNQTGSNSLNVFPFQLSTLDFSTLPHPSLSPAVTAAHDPASTTLGLGLSLVTPARVMSPSPRPAAILSSSGMALGSADSASALVDLDSAEMEQERVIAGPRLFQPLDDDGME